MKILIFEYICGGGFCNTNLPTTLAREGSLMLNALLHDFATLTQHNVSVLLDSRCISNFTTTNYRVIPVNAKDNIVSIFNQALHYCDAVWIIAPETNNILFDLTVQVETLNKLLLSSPSSAIAKTADKLQTFTLLTANNILTIPTQRLIDYPDYSNFPLVIKPIDGVGCEKTYLITASSLKDWQSWENKNNFIIQPFIKGDPLSISALFNRGQAHILCINRQHLQLKNQQFKLLSCEVNISIENKHDFEKLLNKIAKTFPDLFGYVGVDLILSDKLYIVEINPRLTSSYSGIKPALGLNIADLVLQSLYQEIKIKPTINKTIFVKITQE